MKLRRITNNLATAIISSGGIALILVVVGILVFILSQTLPLWKSSSISVRSSFSLADLLGVQAGEVLVIGEEEQKEILFAVTRDGRIHFVSLTEHRILKSVPLAQGRSLVHVKSLPASTHLVLVSQSGHLETIEVKFNTLFDENGRTIIPELTNHRHWGSDTDLAHSACFTAAETREEFLAAWTNGRGSVTLWRQALEGNTSHRQNLPTQDSVTALAINPVNRTLIVGTAKGSLDRWNCTSDDTVRLVETVPSSATSGITAMSFLLGDVMLITGDRQGHLAAWMTVPDHQSNDRDVLRLIRDFPGHTASVTSIVPSWRNKSFLTTDSLGSAHLYHSTSGQLLASASSTTSIQRSAFSPKSDGAIVLDESGYLQNYLVDSPHPEVSAQTLWSKIWYESYEEPTYTWQSTGGTDDFEPKLSLVPLIFGTIKGTLYAMFFAIPLAIMGALYTSQFAHPRVRAIVKPTVEVMAALPSVVVGFMAGLWLAPLMKDALASFFLGIVLVPLLLVVFITWLERLPRRLIQRFKFGYEVFLMMPTLLLAILIGVAFGDCFEEAFLGGDAPNWLYSHLNVAFDQRNCLVVGIALAFASMPIIFTITEDSLSSVPAHLTSASLALGATRWQTAVKVILPAASAGIFSAVMIGFGRAIGETMIVLMATGNTPIMDWSIFNGMRTLSANIAVEIPEAPHGGSLYRVLFLSGLILFLITFVINTLAEAVRQRLRRKYASL